MTRASKRLATNGIPVRLMDLLETDGGWLTLDYMAMKLDEREESVEKALVRLRDRGLVEDRMFELALECPPGGSFRGGMRRRPLLDVRREWRFVGWGEWSA